MGVKYWWGALASVAFVRGKGALALVDTMGNLNVGSSSFYTTLSPLSIPSPTSTSCHHSPPFSTAHKARETSALAAFNRVWGASTLVVFNRGERLPPVRRLMGVRWLRPLWSFFLSFFRKQSFDSNVSGVFVLLVTNASQWFYILRICDCSWFIFSSVFFVDLWPLMISFLFFFFFFFLT